MKRPKKRIGWAQEEKPGKPLFRPHLPVGTSSFFVDDDSIQTNVTPPAGNQSDNDGGGRQGESSLGITARKRLDLDKFDSVSMYMSKKTMVLVPNNDDSMVSLNVDRSNSIFTVTHVPINEKHFRERRSIFGIIGLIRLIATRYFIVITKRTPVSRTNLPNMANSIWRLDAVKLVPTSPNKKRLSEHENRLNSEYIYLILKVLNSGVFYFSYSYEVTTSFHTKPVMTQGQANPDFFWNFPLVEYMRSKFDDIKAVDRFIVPIIGGFVGTREIQVDGASFTVTLISRVDRHMCGPRYYKRGLDTDGHCANFVETEMIVRGRRNQASYVQVRGSLPFFWQQWPTLIPFPIPRITKTQNHYLPFISHFLSLTQSYARVLAINLVGSFPFSRFYEFLSKLLESDKVEYRQYVMKWKEVQKIADEVIALSAEYGYLLDINGKTVSEQTGVVRMNDIDCLEETNTVQAIVAERILSSMIIKMGFFNAIKEKQVAHIKEIFRSIWKDNADAVSLVYTGTGSIKNDFVLHRQRQFRYIVRDWFISCRRWWHTVFSLGYFQDGIDLLQAEYIVPRHEGLMSQSPLTRVHVPKYRSYFVHIPVFIIANFMTFVFLWESDDNLSSLPCILFWFFASMISVSVFVFSYRESFMNRPRLVVKFRKRISF